MSEELRDRFMRHVHPEALSGCWLWHGIQGVRGYGRYTMPGGRLVSAHRLSYEIHVGPIPVGMFVCHRCDVTGCVNPDHLFIGTNADNVADKVAKGRAQRLHGERNGRAKLTWSQVREMRRRIASGERRALLANEYGVTLCVVGKIAIGVLWKEAANA